MRAARTDRDAGGVSSQPMASSHPMLWSVFAAIVVGIVVALLSWKDALVAIVALGPVLAIARADLEARVVPDMWVLVLAGLALDVAIANGGWMEAGEALVRVAASVAVAIGVSRLAGWIVGPCTSGAARDALGTGDLAVVGVSALWLSLSDLFMAVLMSSLAAALVVAARERRSGQGLLRTEVPYAAFLALAAYAVGLMTSVEAATGWTDPATGG